MKLDAFMKERGLDDAAMAELIGDCSEHAVKKWRYAERVPRLDAMRRIQEVTEGLVAPADFFDRPEAVPAQGAAA